MFAECVPQLTNGITIVLVSAQVSGWFCKPDDEENERPQNQLIIEGICVRNSKVLGILCQMSDAEDFSRSYALTMEHEAMGTWAP